MAHKIYTHERYAIANTKRDLHIDTRSISRDHDKGMDKTRNQQIAHEPLPDRYALPVARTKKRELSENAKHWKVHSPGRLASHVHDVAPTYESQQYLGS